MGHRGPDKATAESLRRTNGRLARQIFRDRLFHSNLRFRPFIALKIFSSYVKLACIRRCPKRCVRLPPPHEANLQWEEVFGVVSHTILWEHMAFWSGERVSGNIPFRNSHKRKFQDLQINM